MVHLNCGQCNLDVPLLSKVNFAIITSHRTPTDLLRMQIALQTPCLELCMDNLQGGLRLGQVFENNLDEYLISSDRGPD